MNSDGYSETRSSAQEIPRWPPFVDDDGELIPWAQLTPEQQEECRRRRNLQWQARARHRWAQAVPVEGTRGAAYLESIGIAPPYSRALRYHPSLFCTSVGNVLPALLCAVTPINAPSEIEAVKPIWLDPYGVGTLRTGMLGVIGYSPDGVITLDELAAEIVIGRRVDTAIAAGAVLGLPAVATLTNSSLSRLVLPDTVRRAVFARSRDCRMAALEAWAERERSRGVDIELQRPPDDVEHWTDVAKARL